MNAGRNGHLLTFHNELAEGLTSPQIERLVRLLHRSEIERCRFPLFCCLKGEASQGKTMWVAPQIRNRGIFLYLGPVGYIRVQIRVSVRLYRAVRIFNGQVFRIGKAMPCPLSLGQKWRKIRILVTECLESRDVECHRQIPITHHDRRLRVNKVELHIVTGNQRPSVNGSSRQLGIMTGRVFRQLWDDSVCLGTGRQHCYQKKKCRSNSETDFPLSYRNSVPYQVVSPKALLCWHD